MLCLAYFLCFILIFERRTYVFLVRWKELAESCRTLCFCIFPALFIFAEELAVLMKKGFSHTAIVLFSMFFCFSLRIWGAQPVSSADSMVMGRQLEEARSCFHAGNLRKAMELAYGVSVNAAELEYFQLQALADFRMGLIFLRMEDPVRAIENLNRSYQICRQYGPDDQLMYCLANMAVAYGMAHDYENSISRFEELGRIYWEHGDTIDYVKTLINIAHAYSAIGKPQQALAELNEAARYSYAETALAKDYYLIRGVVLTHLQCDKEAYRLFEAAFAIAQPAKDYEIMARATQGKAEIMENEACYKDAMLEYKRLNRLSDTLNRIKHDKEVYEIESRYQLQQKDQDLVLVSREKRISELRAAILIALLLVVVLAVAFFALRTRTKHYKSLVRNIQLKEKIEENRRVMSGLNIQGQEVSLLLQRLRQNISDLRKNDRLNHRESYVFINRTLEQIQQLMEAWAMSSDGKSNDFALRLESRYPNLSSVEKKTCMLLYIDFSTKEIAESFHISEKSVNNTRSRIRKKMDVPNEMSLTDFLKKIMESE